MAPSAHTTRSLSVEMSAVGLDPKAARILKDLFREYTRRGNTIMMSTHTLEVAESLCDRIAIIQRGVIRASGTMSELRASAEPARVLPRRTGDRASAGWQATRPDPGVVLLDPALVEHHHGVVELFPGA